MRQNQPRRADDRHQGQLHGIVPVAIGQVFKKTRRGTAGIVHQYIDTAKFIRHRTDDAVNIFPLRDIARQRQTTGHLRCSSIQIVLRPPANRDIGAGFMKSQSGGQSNALAASGDKDGFVFQFQFHANRFGGMKHECIGGARSYVRNISLGISSWPARLLCCLQNQFILEMKYYTQARYVPERK
jgi:hypothetical protein